MPDQNANKQTTSPFEIVTSKKKKIVGKKGILIAVLVVVFLVLSVVAGVLLVRQKQNIQEKAAEPDLTFEAGSPVTCSNGFTDNFNNTSLDTTKWTSVGDVSLVSGRVEVVRNESGPSAQADAFYTKNSLSGDFVVEVDIADVIKTGSGGGFASVFFLTDGSETNRLSVNRGKQQNNYIINATLAVGSGNPETTGPINLPRGAVTIKVERKAGKFKVYYKTAGNYILLKSFNGVLSGNIQSVQMHAGNTGVNSNTVVKYDNFKISCAGGPTASPTASPTVSPSGSPTASPTITPTGSPTASPTATPTGTGNPTATPTRTPTATPTSTATPGGGQPNACNGTCGSNSNCQSGLYCYNGYCRNPLCSSNTSCSCSSVAPTPTPTSLAGAGATPRPIPVTGTDWPTMMAGGLGILVILVSILIAL